jgi:hypothetical protein
MKKYYTGVGSRATPQHILQIMTAVAAKLMASDWILRSGGADGADSAFEAGAGDYKHIFYANDATSAAMDIAAKFHPAWNRCSAFAKRLHGRNSFQVLGENLDAPSSMLICWTRDGAYSNNMRSISTGGTGTAISIADHYRVQIFNLAQAAHLARVKKFIGGAS